MWREILSIFGDTIGILLLFGLIYAALWLPAIFADIAPSPAL